ncbi:MAG TPA: helicase-associated domain-containing protein, partial [Spirochaetota bacterium]|nr:helicase-associated domain-containing protein [Spirochaetota bacterium]HOH37638.1 helicase-associated domain-containing protein [Spirochaetota bacterium]
MEKTSKPAIVQSDNTILLEVNNADYEQARDAISPFAELEKSPEHIHTYRITALSLWNAASIGHTRNEIIDTLRKYSRYEVPQTVVASVTEQMMRYGLLYLEKEGDKLILKSKDSMILEEISHNKRIDQFVDSYAGKNAIYVKPELRGHL